MGELRGNMKNNPGALADGLLDMFGGRETDAAECAAHHFAVWMILSRKKLTGEK